jgi:hypothetical protein
MVAGVEAAAVVLVVEAVADSAAGAVVLAEAVPPVAGKEL